MEPRVHSKCEIVMRTLWLLCVLAGYPLLGTTLERLTMDDIVQKSTSIVRGRVTGCNGEMRRNVIYTRCQVSVSETWKGTAGPSAEVFIPGGSVRGLTQTFSGAPELTTGQEYVLFLWAGKSGINQLIGLTQGLFELQQDGKAVTAVRAATSEPMVDAGGRPVVDATLRYSAADLKRIVTAIQTGASR